MGCLGGEDEYETYIAGAVGEAPADEDDDDGGWEAPLPLEIGTVVDGGISCAGRFWKLSLALSAAFIVDLPLLLPLPAPSCCCGDAEWAKVSLAACVGLDGALVPPPVLLAYDAEELLYPCEE